MTRGYRGAIRGFARSAGVVVLAAGCGSTAVVVRTPEPVPIQVVEAVDLTRPPTLAPPPSIALPPIHTRELPNGMRLMIVEHKELPVADFTLLVKTGLEADPPRHSGLASVTAALLDDGTTTRSALEIADQIAYLGVSLGTGAGWDVTTVALHTPTAVLDSALALFADVALRPSFAQDELERLRAERLTLLTQLRDRPTAIADQAYSWLVFGDEHPYGRPTVGTEASVRAISRGDIQRFYSTYYRPNNATLIVVGDVDPDDIVARISTLFGSWERRDVPPVQYARQGQRSGATTIYLIDKPGAAQSSVRIGGVGVARSTEDYFPLLVTNTILGGSFTSRLMQNLRETHGYTYGARSRFDMRTQPGPFTASAEIVAAKTDSALIEFMKELRAIGDTVPGQELQKAKRFLQLQLPAAFETTSDISRQLVPIAVHGLPLDYYNSYVQRIESVTQADVQRVARRYIDPANLAVVVVGDRALVEEDVKRLGIGPVEIRDLTGRPVRQ
jgi:zinc protease